MYGDNIFSDENVSVGLDSHIRYLSGILMAIGLCFWSFIPNLENKTREIRLLSFVVFVGGLSRLSFTILTGDIDKSIFFAVAMELLITPLICFWQSRFSIK